MNRAAEFALLLTLPAAVALMIMPGAIVATLFERGAFGPEDSRAVAAALGLFAFGLPAFVLQKVVQPAFFAREDMVSPLRFAAISVAVNVAISVLGAPILGFLSIALGTSVGGWVHLWLLWRGLAPMGTEATIDRRLRDRAPGMLKASLAMGAVVWLLTWGILPAMLADTDGRWTALAMIIATGAGTYAYALRRLDVVALGELRAALRRGT
jgi:putative peptidoglycan lipid II flippase